MKRVSAILMAIILLGVTMMSTACDKTKGVTPVVTIEMDDGKKIVVELYPEYAPNTVANFVALVQKGFYDGTVFHRIINGFMIQGGDPEGTGMGGPGHTIKGEFSNNGYSKNTLKHERGVISMARNGISMDSAGSQFFIMHADSSHLDGDYAAFGKVIEGMDVVDEIAKGKTVGSNGEAVEPRIMKTVTVDTKGVEWPAPETTAN